MRWWPGGGKCPIDDERRRWVDGRMRWLGQQFGMEVWLRAPAVVPTDAFFPDRYEPSERGARQMCNRVCRFMGVEESSVELRLFTGERPKTNVAMPIQTLGKGAAGYYLAGERPTVAVDSASLSDPQKLVATLAHELAHVRLLGEGRISREEEDHEPVTDLATVFFGLGVFTANTTFQYSQWHGGGFHGWKASKLGYMNELQFGYALGLWAHVRGETSPPWLRHLRLNPRTYAKQTMGYLKAFPVEFDR